MKKKITPKDLRIESSINSMDKNIRPVIDEGSEFCIHSDGCITYACVTNRCITAYTCGTNNTLMCTVGWSDNCGTSGLGCGPTYPESVNICIDDTRGCPSPTSADNHCPIEETKITCADTSSEPETCTSDCDDAPPETIEICASSMDGCSD